MFKEKRPLFIGNNALDINSSNLYYSIYDTYKKQIVFPELQKINSYIDEYIMLTNNYDRSILNKNSEGNGT